MASKQEITGVILAGGKSSRFGSNKALVLWQGKHLIQHVRDTLAAVFDDCLLVTNTPEQFRFLNLPMVGDSYQNLGALAGIHAALRHTDKSWIFVVGCDMPAITPALITFLCGLAHREYDAVIPWPASGPEPLCGLYHKNGLALMEQQLQDKKVQLKDLLGKLSVRKVKEEELRRVTDTMLVFSNVNRRQDLDSLPAGSG